MEIAERDFFEGVHDDWILERVLNIRVHCLDTEIVFTADEIGSRLPRTFAAAYAWYLAVVARRTRLAEQIQEAFSVMQKVVLRDCQLVFSHGQDELQIAVTGVFRHCSLAQIQQWLPEVLHKIATPAHLPLFTADVLLAIRDEALLTVLFERLPLLWLPTSSVVVVSLSSGDAAYRVAVRQHRLLMARR